MAPITWSRTEIYQCSYYPHRPGSPYPYTLLSLIPFSTTHCTILDLKNTFFTIPLHIHSQDPFAFTWIDPDNHFSQQLTRTVLPQGFCDSPHFFDQALASDLTSLDLISSTVLQYMDDFLLCCPSFTLSQQHTIQLLNFLSYQVSPTKVQLSLPRVTCLGVPFNTNEKIYYYRKKVLYIQFIPSPTTPYIKNRDPVLLRVSWIAKPLDSQFCLTAVKTTHILSHPRRYFRTPSSAFNTLKQTILSAPALTFLDLFLPFILYITEKHKIAIGVLKKKSGPLLYPISYLSKQLDTTIQGWPACLCALPAAALLAQESKKLTFGASTFIHSPHDLRIYSLTNPWPSVPFTHPTNSCHPSFPLNTVLLSTPQPLSLILLSLPFIPVKRH